MINVYLLLGSNLGNRHYFIEQAVKSIQNNIAAVERASALYETAAWGKNDEPDYLNQVILIKTAFDAHIILETVLAIELSMGRQRDVRWGSRTIDIDILFYGAQIINEPNLQVPHPRLHERGFTLAPLAEIAPNLIHPVIKKTINELKNELKDGLIVKKL